MESAVANAPAAAAAAEVMAAALAALAAAAAAVEAAARWSGCAGWEPKLMPRAAMKWRAQQMRKQQEQERLALSRLTRVFWCYNNRAPFYQLNI